MREYLERFNPAQKVGAVRYWGEPVPFGEAQARLLCGLEHTQAQGLEPLKRSLRRSVYRVSNFAPDWPPVVVKKFPLAKLESRFKYRKYGLAEFVHCRRARESGVAAPRCHGYFEIRSLGLVAANGVILEDLRGRRGLEELAEAEPGRREEIWARVIPVLRVLFENGVNHIDTCARNFLGTRDGPEVWLIDWQYCSFVQPRQPAQLLLHAAHFMASAGLDPASEPGRAWVVKLLQACGEPVVLKPFLSAAARLLGGPKVSIPDRLRLALDPGTARGLRGPD